MRNVVFAYLLDVDQTLMVKTLASFGQDTLNQSLLWVVTSSSAVGSTSRGSHCDQWIKTEAAVVFLTIILEL